MHALLLPSAALSVILTILAAPKVNVTITEHAELERGSYIVKLKDSVSKDTHIANLLSDTSHSKITHKYKDDSPFYAVELTDHDLDFVRRSSDVESIREDGILNVESETSEASSEANPGVQFASHLSKRRLRGPGSGVDVYVVDTGIYARHSRFNGLLSGMQQHANWGWAFDNKRRELSGHGTHIAGLIGGRGFGPATSARLIAVKVSAHGPGEPKDIRNGIQWVIDEVVAGQRRDPLVDRPAIIHLSFPIEPTYVNFLDEVMQYAAFKCIHMVIGAGDESKEIGEVGPQGLHQAIVVGAVNNRDQIAPFSNYGSFVDVWAPGVDIESAWIGYPSAVQSLNGTAQAAAHVTGLLAKMLSNSPKTLPVDAIAKLHEHARRVLQQKEPEIGKEIPVAADQ